MKIVEVLSDKELARKVAEDCGGMLPEDCIERYRVAVIEEAMRREIETYRKGAKQNAN